MAHTREVVEAVAQVARATTWDARIAIIRQIPDRFGAAAQRDVYAAIAERVYVPHIIPDFAYVHWAPGYDLADFERAYGDATRLTEGFTRVGVNEIARAIVAAPRTLRVFRTILGLTSQEFAAATRLLLNEEGAKSITATRSKSIEAGAIPKAPEARACAEIIDQVINGRLLANAPVGGQPKVRKPDTGEGWITVRALAADGVPYSMFLHQRHYGGAFRQLLDATSSRRGNALEDAVEAIFSSQSVMYFRTGSSNQDVIARRFGLTVRPAPDFVVFDSSDTLRAIVECKAANDGGTARDKAARFRNLRQESQRLGGVPVFAVLSGLGWTRTGDALGPVIQATDGRTLTLATLHEIVTVSPFPSLIHQ